MEGESRFSNNLERIESPREELEHFLKTYNEIMKTIGWLVEASQNFSTLVVAVKRQRLAGLYASLGLNHNNPADRELLQGWYSDIMARQRNPQPGIGIPSVETFAHRIALITEMRSTSTRATYTPYRPVVSEIARFAWTDWRRVESRNPDHISTPAYIRDVARIIADPVAYELTFGAHTNDTLEITPSWEVANGRHRSLAVACLGASAVRDGGLDSWVTIGMVPY